MGWGRHWSSPPAAARIAATRACSRSRNVPSVCGARERTCAAPRLDVANSATTSSTRGNSRIDSAWEFTDRKSVRWDCRRAVQRSYRRPGSALLPRRELLAHDRVDDAALGAPLELA